MQYESDRSLVDVRREIALHSMLVRNENLPSVIDESLEATINIPYHSLWSVSQGGQAVLKTFSVFPGSVYRISIYIDR